MKLIFLITIVFVTLLSIVSVRLAYAQNSPEPTVEQVIQQILSKQNVTTVSLLDCSKIPKDDFVELGDALMERMIGNHQLHEQMHAMMGGENSSSVVSMHEFMGTNWVGCTNSSQQLFNGMMGQNGMMGMMPMMNMMSGGMMGNSGYFGYWNLVNVLYVILLIGLIILVYLWIIRLWKGLPRKKRR